MNYLARWRMQQADRLLRDRRLSVAQVAEQLGYATEASFRRAFKRIRGVGPGAVRRLPLP
jgi:AraC-like DNA-binding protein